MADLGLDRKWEILLLHHSHTDIGYTDTQDGITREQISYIREVIDELKSGRNPSFRWICESLWAVESFFDDASEDEIRDFISLVREGKISLSASYLNMTEAIDGTVYTAARNSIASRLAGSGIKPTVALTSDVNGYAWGFCDILAESGAKLLVSQINQTHGRVPFDRPHTPFIWEGAHGNKIGVWISDHYMTGNVVGLEPVAGAAPDAFLSSAEEKIPAYLRKLAAEGYEYSFIPLGISGAYTDNSPPNFAVSESVRIWNEAHGDEVTVRLCTLEDFEKRFDTIRDLLPVYRGDWTDYWADGISSTPDALRLFRDAQRTALVNERIRPGSLTDSIAHDLTMYAEHTWGHYASVTDPWEHLVYELEAKKNDYAVRAHIGASEVRDEILTEMGQLRKSCTPSEAFGAFSVSDITSPVSFLMRYPDVYFDYKCLRDEDTGHIYPIETAGGKIRTVLPLRKKRIVRLRLDRCDADLPPLMSGCDNYYETDRFAFTVDAERGGVVSLVDKKYGRELIRTHSAAFRPIYEVTPVVPGHNFCEPRAECGLVRRTPNTVRHYGTIENVTVENGPVFASLTLHYHLKSCLFAKIVLCFSRGTDRIDVKFFLHKNCVWEPESVYLDLPFTDAEGEVVIDKTNCLLRPGIDQLPKSCANFYSTQNGICFFDREGTTAISCTDAPLIWMGDLGDLTPAVCTGDAARNRAPVYSWVMNTIWETNFKAEIGGFHSFDYLVMSLPPIDAKTAFDNMRDGVSAPLAWIRDERKEH